MLGGPIERLTYSNKRKHSTTNRTVTDTAGQWLSEAGDMVLVYATAFRGWHKIQIRWENREYVEEWQPYPNLPVYVVCPRDGEGCSQTLHRHYLLPISNNLEQVEDENSVGKVEPIDKPTPVPPADAELPADWPTESQLESPPSLPPKQQELVNPESTGLATQDLVNDGSQAGQDQPGSAKMKYMHDKEPTPKEIPKLCTTV